MLSFLFCKLEHLENKKLVQNNHAVLICCHIDMLSVTRWPTLRASLPHSSAFKKQILTEKWWELTKQPGYAEVTVWFVWPVFCASSSLSVPPFIWSINGQLELWALFSLTGLQNAGCQRTQTCSYTCHPLQKGSFTTSTLVMKIIIPYCSSLWRSISIRAAFTYSGVMRQNADDVPQQLRNK